MSRRNVLMAVIAAVLVSFVVPAGASAAPGLCNDGTHTNAAGTQGACSHHHGLAGSSQSTSGSGTSTITQADCDAGRIRRNGRTLTGAECRALIGQRVNLAGTGFDARIPLMAGLMLIGAGFGVRRRRPRGALTH
ncbi:MAG: hypothetical protein QOE06_3260 [Thermoleophilaceae bacterium]|jgi:hypothetical protein|nr:hypothetical protein [Thermoleophilaceae bacterium]